MNEHYSLRTLLRKKIRTCKCSFKQNISVAQHPDLAVCIACNFFIKTDHVSVTKSKVHPEFSQMSKKKLLANKNIHKRLLFSAWMSLFVFFFFIRNLFKLRKGGWFSNYCVGLKLYCKTGDFEPYILSRYSSGKVYKDSLKTANCRDLFKTLMESFCIVT